MKVIKKCMLFIIASALAAFSLTSVFSATRYFENGYYYSFLNNNAVELVGWDNRTSELPVPSTLNGRPVTAIANNAFMNDTDLTGIDFTNAENLGSIGLYSFSNCTNITGKLVLPDNVFFVDICAFEGCSSLQELEINSDLQNISDQCFNKCTSLSSVKLNDGLEQILNYSFANCTALSRVEIPESVTYIAPTAFNNDPNLTIYGFAGSFAQTYAQEHSIPFVEWGGYMLGDADGNGVVNINDVTTIQRDVALLESLQAENFLAGDVNGNGIIDINDATELQSFLAEYHSAYPIGEIITVNY